MINSVSFGSTYRAYITKQDAENGRYGFSQLTKYLDKNNIQYNESLIEPSLAPTPFNPYKTNDYSQYIPSINDFAVSKNTITALDAEDTGIETILANLGIKFEKISTKNILKPNAIRHRIKLAPKGYFLADVNIQKLEELVKNQDTNFEHCKYDYDNYFKEQTDFILRSGDEITPQTLLIRYLDNDSTPESLKKYIERFGKDKLNPNSISIWQEQRDINYNAYYGLKDLGFKRIPVYLDKDSYKNAQALGILD